MGETKMVTFDQTTVRRLKEIVSSHARNLGCGGTCLDDACQYDGPCDIADIMETLWAASGGIDVVSMPAQTYGTLRAQLAEANAACAAMREALEATFKTCRAAREALYGVIGLVDESRGVVGWHLNGNEAPWSEFNYVTDYILPTELVEVVEQLSKCLPEEEAE